MSNASKLITSVCMTLSLLVSAGVQRAAAIDVTAPSSVTYVYDGLNNYDATMTYAPSTLSANWDASIDAESGIAAYWYSIGTSSGASDVVSWTDNGTATWVVATGLSLTNGITYYFTVKAENGDGLFATPTNSNGAYMFFDATAPDVGASTVYDGLELYADLMYASSTTTISAVWSPPYESESGILAYWYAVGTATGATDVVDWTFNATSAMMDDNGLSLSEGVTYYVSMKAQNLSEVFSNVISSDGVTIDSVAPTAPAFVYDNGLDDMNFSSNSISVSIHWGTSTDVTSDIYAYYYAYGSTPGATDIVNWQSGELMMSASPYTPGGFADGIYYASVYAMDNAKNKSDVTFSDGLYIDTVGPQIIDNEPAGNTWLNADAGVLYDVDFSDDGSGLEAAYYSVYDGPSMSGTNTISSALIDFGFGAASMATDWPVDFTALSEGISYVSVMTNDMAVNPASLMDAFTILKDTVPPESGSFFSPMGFLTSTDVSTSYSQGTDVTSGISGAAIWRREAPMQVNLCDAYGAWSVVNASAPVSTWMDTSPVPGNCYQYKLEVYDFASNTAEYCNDGPGCLAPVATKVSASNGAIDCQTYSDISQNGLVNLVDLATLIRNYGYTGPIESVDCTDGDLNLDASIDLMDIAAFKANYHTTYGYSMIIPTLETPASVANPAVITLDTTALSIKTGDTITVDVNVDPMTESYYGVDVFLSYATDVYSVSSVVTSGMSEMFNSYSTDTGIISFGVYNITPSLTGSPMTIATITLNVMADATGTIDFVSDLANDKYTAALADGMFNATSTPLYVFVSVGPSLTLGPDTTPPTDISVVNDGYGADIDYASSTTNVPFNWSASTDPESGIATYYASLGTTPGATDVASWATVGVSTAYSFSGLTLSDGMTYYVNVMAENNAGSLSAVTSSDGFLVDMTAPTGTTYVSAFMDSFTFEITANWDDAMDSESGILGYYYAIGSSTSTTSDVVPWTLAGPATATSFMASLTDGMEYYASVKAMNNAGLYSSEITAAYPFLYDASVPVGPTYVYDGSGADIDFSSDTTMLEANWDSISDPDSDIYYVRYAIGTSQGIDDVQQWTDIYPASSVITTGLTLSDGVTYYISVKGINGVLSEGVPAYSDGVTIDTTAPSAVTVSDGLSTDIDNSTSTTSLSANWTASTDAGSGVAGYWYSIGTAIGLTDTLGWTNGGSNLNFTESLTLTEGMTYYVNVMVEDNLGNMSTVASSDGVTITGTPPSSAVTSPANGARLSSVTSITGTATDVGTGVSAVYVSIKRTSDNLYWDSSKSSWGTIAWMLTSGTTSWTLSTGLPTWADGAMYTIQSKSVSSTGSEETPGSGNSFTFDTTGPSITVSSPINGSVTGSASATVSGTTEAGATLTVNGVSVSVGQNGAFSTTVTLTEGSNSISLLATDTAGNTGSASVSVSLDTTNPTAEITSPTPGTVSGTITITGTASDSHFQGYTLDYGYGSAPATWYPITSSTSPVTSGTLGSFDSTYLAGGYTLRLTVTDTAGNTIMAMILVTISNTVSLTKTVAAGEWSLISLPMTPDSGSMSKLTASADLWVFWWSPTATSDPTYAKYVKPTSVSAGQGLWITPKSSTTGASISLTGDTVDTGGTGSFDYDVQPGWNMIGTPFNLSTMWNYLYVDAGSGPMDISSAVSAGLLESTPFYYDGLGWGQLTQTSSQSMDPGSGYFLYVTSSTQISLVYNSSLGMGRATGKIIKTSPVLSFSISAETANAHDRDNIIALSTSASDGYDTSDLREPPGAFGKYVSLYFPHDQWDRNAGRYANDTRSVQGVDSGCSDATAGICKRWTFKVDTNDTGNVNLSWPDLSEYEGAFNISLIDGASKTDMISENDYSYSAASGKTFTVELSRKAPAMRTVSKGLKKGWNLISIPVDPVITEAAANLADDMAALDIFQFHNDRLISQYDSDGVDIQAGLGYWIYSAEDFPIDVEGFPVDFLLPVQIPLVQGWNLLGNPYEENLAWGDNIKFSCGGAEMTLFNAIASGKISADIFTADSGGSYTKKSRGDSIEPWTGFFVKTFESCDIIIRK